MPAAPSPVLPQAPPWYALGDFIARSALPDTDIKVIEQRRPGKIASLIAMHQAWITARLRKRGYQTAPPVQELCLLWLTRMVDPDAYRVRGVNAQSDDQIKRLDDLADAARSEVKEAASAVDNLFDLPLADTDTNASTTGVTQASPLGYSEQSPYAWQGIQQAALQGGGGTTGDVVNPFGTTDDTASPLVSGDDSADIEEGGL